MMVCEEAWALMMERAADRAEKIVFSLPVAASQAPQSTYTISSPPPGATQIAVLKIICLDRSQKFTMSESSRFSTVCAHPAGW